MNTPQMAAYARVRSVASTGASRKKPVILIIGYDLFACKNKEKAQKRVSLFEQRCLNSSNLLSLFVK